MDSVYGEGNRCSRWNSFDSIIEPASGVALIWSQIAIRSSQEGELGFHIRTNYSHCSYLVVIWRDISAEFYLTSVADCCLTSRRFPESKLELKVMQNSDAFSGLQSKLKTFLYGNLGMELVCSSIASSLIFFATNINFY